ncbi:MAG: sigma-70 family RNA polymerase sigma factor [Bacteroidota bacterium]
MLPPNDGSDGLELHFLKMYNERNPEGWDYFYRKLYPEILAYTTKILNGNHISEDITQDSFVTVWNAKNEFPDAGRLKGYHVVVAYRDCVDFIRRSKRLENPEDHEDIPLDISADPDSLERYKRVLEKFAAAKTTPLRKKVFQETLMNGKKVKSYAADNGMAVGYVSKIRSVIRKELQKMLKALRKK